MKGNQIMKKIVLVLLFLIQLVVFSQDFTDINAGITGIGFGDSDWGDYDNDGDLDVIITGEYSDSPVTGIYRNDRRGGSFTNISSGISGLLNSSVAWGDYDNDGDLDVLIIGNEGMMGSPDQRSKIYRNDDGTFVDINAGLIEVESGSVAWGDYDNDGDLDIFICGYDSWENPYPYYPPYGNYTISKIYQNNNGVFTDINAGLTGLRSSDGEWGDYDNDGDLDILLTGFTGAVRVSSIYRNDSGVFTDINAGLSGISSGDVDWGDYDNDSDLDIILTGYDDSKNSISKIYRNDSGVFTDINAGLTGVSYVSVAWGDYDNDGDLDIIISSGEIFRNDDSTFTHIETEIEGGDLGSINWGDCDNDSDLDILVSGYNSSNETNIYRNNTTTLNNQPTSPTNLKADQNGPRITFTWDKATDNETPQDGLSYNLYIGSVSGLGNILSPESIIYTGKRMKVGIGNVNQNTFWTINNLEPGTYYWSVQTIDHSYVGSEFAEEQEIIVTSIGSDDNVILTTELLQNYPNPFNPETTISYAIPNAAQVMLNVYNIQGQLVETLVNGKMDKGYHTVNFNASGQTTGLYIYDLRVDGVSVESRKMMLVK